MGKTVHTEAVRDLFEAILTLETEEECFNFFEDVCTVNELLSIAQRFAVAKMLKEDNTYLEVAEKTGASPDRADWLPMQKEPLFLNRNSAIRMQ